MKIAVCVASLLLCGCTIERTVMESPSTTVAVEQTVPLNVPVLETAPDVSVENKFLEDMHGSSFVSRDMPDDLLLDTAYETCTAFNSGVTLFEVAALVEANSSDAKTQDMLEWIIVYAVFYFCPEFTYMFDSTT